MVSAELDFISGIRLSEGLSETTSIDSAYVSVGTGWRSIRMVGYEEIERLLESVEAARGERQKIEALD